MVIFFFFYYENDILYASTVMMTHSGWVAKYTDCISSEE